MYAILYAVLIVIMVSMAGFALDISAARADRRADKSLADSAALAGGMWLDSTAIGGMQPYKACLTVWQYLHAGNSEIADLGASACAPFNATAIPDPESYCKSPSTATMPATTDATNGYVVQIEWPVPEVLNGDPTKPNPFLNGDIAPGDPKQKFDPLIDGESYGCTRLGVAVSHHREFGISSAIGIDGTTTLSHSVVNVVIQPGKPSGVAALNVLDKTACPALNAAGQAAIVVTRSPLTGSPPAHLPGIIAVESNGSKCGNATSDYVIWANPNPNNYICASGAEQAVTCSQANPGTGLILSHAMDPGGQKPYSPSQLGIQVSGTFKPEGGTSGASPVTSIYGCETGGPLAPCSPTGANRINELVAALGTGTPTSSPPIQTYPAIADPDYTGPGPSYPATGTRFLTIGDPPYVGGVNPVPAFKCNLSGQVYIPPGNWYVNCPDPNSQKQGFTFNGSSTSPGVLIFGGGTIVFAGGVNYAGGCLAFNVPDSNFLGCPITAGTGTTPPTVSKPANGPAIVFIRGNGLTNGGSNASIALQKTFVYQAAGGSRATLNIGAGSGTVLWTSPGADSTADSQGQLQQMCTDNGALSAPSDACLTQHFEKLTYWNANSAGDTLGGQASIQYIGVFFTPSANFTIGGQACGVAQSAQFWAATLTTSGTGCLTLTPNPNLQISRPLVSVSLIR